jgi:hypothetical protein
MLKARVLAIRGSASGIKRRSNTRLASVLLAKRSMADSKLQQKFIEDQKSMGRIMKEKGAAGMDFLGVGTSRLD